MRTLVALCLLLPVPLAAAPRPLLHYPMTEGKGAAVGDTAGRRDAAVARADWVRNASRAALRCEGRGPAVVLEPAAPLPLQEAFSADLWYNTERTAEPVGLIALPGTFRVLLYPSSRKLLVDVFSRSGARVYRDPAGPVRPRTWQHLALTCAPGQGVVLYLNGHVILSDPTALGQLAPGGVLRLGCDTDPALPRYFRGLLGGLRLWNRALAPEEIAAIIREESPPLMSAFRGENDLRPKLPAPAALPVGDRKQLLFDDRFVEASRGIVRRMNPPQKLGAVLRPERPWEDNSFGFCASVLQHDSTFRLYYETWSTKGTFVCLATSSDGERWERPKLGLIEVDGSRENNIVWRADGESVVFLDPHGKPEERFKMIAMGHWPDPKTGGLYCHTSPDGRHWTAGPRVLDLGPDTANQAAWDRQRGKYVAYVRKWDPLRKIGRIETDDIMQPWPYTPLGDKAYFIWGKQSIAVPSREMPTAFGYDDRDPVVSDHYNPAVVEYPWAADAYFAFPAAYLHYPEPPAGKYGNDGVLDLQLAVSRDGVQFERPVRGSYVGLGLPGEPDALSNYMAVGMVRRGSYLYQYYGGYAVTHGLPEAEQKRPIGSLCGLRQRLDGFLSLDADWDGGELLTPPLTFTGKRLELNLDASAMGLCRVGLLDAAGEPLPGFETDNCDEVRGNDVAHVVRWEGREDLSALAGKTVRLHFVMRAAKLYAFQFAP